MNNMNITRNPDGSHNITEPLNYRNIAMMLCSEVLTADDRKLILHIITQNLQTTPEIRQELIAVGQKILDTAQKILDTAKKGI